MDNAQCFKAALQKAVTPREISETLKILDDNDYSCESAPTLLDLIEELEGSITEAKVMNNSTGNNEPVRK